LAKLTNDGSIHSWTHESSQDTRVVGLEEDGIKSMWPLSGIATGSSFDRWDDLNLQSGGGALDNVERPTAPEVTI